MNRRAPDDDLAPARGMAACGLFGLLIWMALGLVCCVCGCTPIQQSSEHDVIAGLYTSYDSAATAELAWLQEAKRPKATVQEIERLRIKASEDLTTLMLTNAAQQPTAQVEAIANQSLEKLRTFMEQSNVPFPDDPL